METKLKACHVCIRPLENILFDEAKVEVPAPSNDLPSGEHYTRSKTRKPVVRTGRIPRKASIGKQYEEATESPTPRKRKPLAVKPLLSDPQRPGIAAQHTKTPYPSRRLPPTNSNGDGEMTVLMMASLLRLGKHHLHTKQTEKQHPPRKKVLSLQKATLFAKIY